MLTYEEDEIRDHDLQWFVSHLAELNGFRVLVNTESNTLLVYDDMECEKHQGDVLTIFVTKEIVIITAGGYGVIPTWNILQRRVTAEPSGEWGFWTELLQTVLHKF